MKKNPSMYSHNIYLCVYVLLRHDSPPPPKPDWWCLMKTLAVTRENKKSCKRAVFEKIVLPRARPAWALATVKTSPANTSSVSPRCEVRRYWIKPTFRLMVKQKDSGVFIRRWMLECTKTQVVSFFVFQMQIGEPLFSSVFAGNWNCQSDSQWYPGMGGGGSAGTWPRKSDLMEQTQ